MRIVPSILLVACVAGVACVGSALAQLGPGGGGPGGGGPGGGGGGGPGGGGPGGGGGGASPTFSFAICNKAANSPQVYVGVVSLAPGQLFRAQGWWTVNNGQCSKLGDFQRPGVLFYAADGKGNWWGKQENQDGALVCVNLNGPFNYTWDAKQTRNCAAGEQAVPFFLIQVKPEVPGFQMTLN